MSVSNETKMYINEYGDKLWRNEKGELHREDGPAIEYPDGYKQWYINGKRHRADGPAIEGLYQLKKKYTSTNDYLLDVVKANSYNKWYYDGQEILCRSQEEFERIIKLKAFW